MRCCYPVVCPIGYASVGANCSSPADKTPGTLMILPCLQEDTVVFLLPPQDHCISTLTNNSFFLTSSLKALLKSYFSFQVSHLHLPKVPAASSRSLRLFLWQIKVLKSRWGVSICHTNLRSVHWPLIHDLWKQLTFSWGFQPDRLPAPKRSAFYCYHLHSCGLLLIVEETMWAYQDY